MSELDVPPPPDTAVPRSGADWVAPFLLELAAALDAAPVRWMVLRNYEDLPDQVGHDVDLVVHPRDAPQVDGIMRAVVRREGAALLRAYAGTEHETFDVTAGDLSGRLVLHVDVQTAARHRGRVLVDAEDLLAHRRRAGPLRHEAVDMAVRWLGAGHWRAVDARLDLEDHRLLVKLPVAQREQLRQAHAQNVQVLRLWHAGQAKEALPLARRVLALRRGLLGETHRDVATALFISPKTVESNLARIYRKLGIHSRAELGRHMGQPGL